MTRTEAVRLLDRARTLRHACDLDLLLFFVRHPRAFLARESLARLLGYGPKEIAESLDTLLAAGLITRTQTRAHAAQLYVLGTEGALAEWLPPLVQAASTRSGRLSLMQALERGPREPESTRSGNQ